MQDKMQIRLNAFFLLMNNNIEKMLFYLLIMFPKEKNKIGQLHIN